MYLNIYALHWSVSCLGYFIQVLGHCSFHSNILQVNIDQLIGASANKLSAIIDWHSVAIEIVVVILKVVNEVFTERFFHLICSIGC